MPIFEQGDVVRVPFPYTNGATKQHRPALVVSAGPLGETLSLIWVAMITSAANRGWHGDVPFGGDFQRAGLPIPSVVRPLKIATIETLRAERLGCVSPLILKAVMARIEQSLQPNRGVLEDLDPSGQRPPPAP